MNGAVDTLIDVAATARLTRLITEDEITRELREWVEDRTGSESRLTYLVNCPYCVSVWAGAAMLVTPKPIRRLLALSAGALGARMLGQALEAM